MSVSMVLLFLVPYALTLAMPSWRWLLAYFVLVAALLALWFAQIVTTPLRTGLEVLGLLFIVPVAISTAAGALIRTVTLIMTARRRSGTVAISVLGSAIPLASLAALVIWANR